MTSENVLGKFFWLWKSDISPASAAAASCRGGSGGEKGMMMMMVYSSHPPHHYFYLIPIFSKKSNQIPLPHGQYDWKRTLGAL